MLECIFLSEHTILLTLSVDGEVCPVIDQHFEQWSLFKVNQFVNQVLVAFTIVLLRILNFIQQILVAFKLLINLFGIIINVF